jgi:hypothetical protein
MPNNQQEYIYIIGIDMIGLQGHLYKAFQYEDAVAVLKLAEDNIFLPSDADDLQEFFCESCLLFRVKCDKSNQDIQESKSSRKYNK